MPRAIKVCVTMSPAHLRELDEEAARRGYTRSRAVRCALAFLDGRRDLQDLDGRRVLEPVEYANFVACCSVGWVGQ